MEKYLTEIENIHPIVTSARRKNFRPLYAVLCGIESEYAICVLKKNKEDSLFKHIASYYLTQDTSAKSLFREFSLDSEMAALHSLLKFDENDEDSISRILNKIKWISKPESNTFLLDKFQFTSDKLFIDLIACDGKNLCFERKTTKGEDDIFEAIGVRDFSGQSTFKAKFNIRQLMSDGHDVEPYKYAATPRISDEAFFNVTGKLREADDEQRAAIRADTNKNLLIIAGAGSGKTRSLIGRLTYLHLVHGVPLNKLLLLTFTRAATQEMATAGNQQIREAYLSCGAAFVKNPHVLSNTIDGFFKQLIEKYYLDVGFMQKPRFLLDNIFRRERLSLLVNVINDNHLNNVFSEYLKDEKSIEKLYKALDNFADGMTVNISGLENLLELFVEKQIKENLIVDFVYSGCILKRALNNKNCPLYNRLAEMYDCILIDEFQDINKLQNDVLSKFYDSAIHFTFVGDDDQTIYTWRGADNEIIRAMANNAEVNTVYLTTNYRNNPYIVNAGNDILANLEDRAKIGRTIKAAKKSGTKVRITRYDEKYENLADEIKNVYQSRRDGEKICILFRQVNDQIKMIDGHVQRVEGEGEKLARILDIKGVPSVFEKDEGVEFSDGYKLLKAILCILNKLNVRDSCSAIKELLKIPSVSNVNIRRLVQGKILASQIKNSPSSAFTPAMLAMLAESVNQKYSYAQTVFELVCNYNRTFAAVCENQRETDRAVRDETLKLFQKLTGDYDWKYPIRKDVLIKIFHHFEEEISPKRGKRTDEDVADAVIISSIHKAKGLQYDTVFIVGLNDGEYPNDSQIKAEYDRRVSEFMRLKRSQDALGQLRTSITKATIEKLKQSCRELADRYSGEEAFATDILSLYDEIDVWAEDYQKLTEEGVDAFTEAYYAYLDGHIQMRRDMLVRKSKEILALREQADMAEELYHESEEESTEEHDRYVQWQLLEKEIGIKQDSLTEYQNKLNGFLNSLADFIAYYEVCNKAKGYLIDCRKSRNERAMIHKLERDKIAKEQEELRLFYVAVSRASEKLYLCARKSATVSPFVKMIDSANCEMYEMRTQTQQEALKQLEKEIQLVREEVTQVQVDESKVDKGIAKILNYSDAFKIEIHEYINQYSIDRPIYNNLPSDAKRCFENAIGLLALSEKLGYDFKTEIVHNLQRFIQCYIQGRIGKRAKPYKCDNETAETILNGIREIAGTKCKAGIPGKSYLESLLTQESKYGDELKQCKSLIIQCYIVCSGKYHVPTAVADTWSFSRFTCVDHDDFLVAGLDLSNLRNLMIHDNQEIWTTDYFPYALDCVDIIMKYFA